MASLSRFQKIALLSLGAVGGGLAYYRINNDKTERRYNAHNSWTTNFTPSVQWDRNWDHREPESIVKPIKNVGNPEEDNKYNEKLEKAKSRAVRHLFLIRHGQYNIDGAKDKDRTLTELGRLQADFTGQRLALLDIKWDCLVQSTMTRAQETGQIIAKHLDKNIEVKNCQLIEEGAPIPPEPPVGHWRPEPKFFQDSVRIEAGFRRYFHRAPPDQTDDTYTLLVCHANVIRYFVCKALQFPPEAWLRISLNHASITWISIMPNGNVVLRSLSDTGHMEPKFVTSRNSSLKRNAKIQLCKEQNGTNYQPFCHEQQFYQDSARIEAGFRRYFYRAPPDQQEDSYTLLVAHANVIRFFVCKALQFPPEGWLRMSVNHASITQLSILPNGNVILRSLSESGYMDPHYVTFM